MARYTGDGGLGRSRTQGRFCKRCGRSLLHDHTRLTEKSDPMCDVEFTWEDKDGNRVEPEHADLITFGPQRTKRNKAAWVHVSRL